MTLARRTFLNLAAGVAAAPVLPGRARADTYPTRPVQIVVDLPAGLAPDVAARLIAPPLAERLGQSVVVENKPGAGGNIGAEYVVRAAPDGYTLLLVISGNAVNATLYPKLTFDFLRDIAPVAFIGVTPFVLAVNPVVPGEDDSRIHRLRQGKSRQDQRRVGRRRHRAAPRRRVVQDDGRRRSGAVRYRTNYFADVLSGQVPVSFVAVAPGRSPSARRQAARSRRHQRDPHEHPAGYSGHRRVRAGL